MLVLSFGEVELKAPETPPYLRIALDLLRLRLEELERESRHEAPQVPDRVTPQPPPPPREVPPPREAPPTPPRPGPPSAGGQVRWFRTHLPRVVLPDGTVRLFRTLEDLRRFVEERGLTPHKRGDASILVWQIRHRLRLPVDEVPIGAGA